ncbi:MAG: hypothetical protein ACI9FJ_002382 [Alteromonadaceae bacterium]|jgi:hypothetical protein
MSGEVNGLLTLYSLEKTRLKQKAVDPFLLRAQQDVLGKA